MVLHNAAVTGSLTVNGVDVSSITGSSPTSASFASQIASLNAATASLNTYTSSNNTNISALNAQSASFLAYTASNDAKITSLNTFSSSILSYTSSNDAQITSIYSTTSSLNSYTSSANTKFAGLDAASGSAITRLSALEVASGSAINRLSSLETASGSAITRLNSIENRTGSYATTGSNIFDGGQYFSSSFNPTGFTTTASLYTDGGLRVTKDMYVSGTAYFNNITVFGTQSVAYISSSQLNIGTNIISVNTDTPSVRFGGLAVYDSGSTGLTGSMLWDSQNNHWVYSNPSGSSYSGGMFISGPRSSALGSEQGTTLNSLMKGQGGDHMTSSAVFDVSGSVGIGTSSPSYSLDVQGIYGQSTTSTQPFVIYGDSGDTNGLFRIQMDSISDSFGTGARTFLGDGGIDLFLGTANSTYTPNNTYIALNHSGEISMGAGAATKHLVINTSGNVGIGTSTPGYKLDVNGTGRFSGSLTGTIATFSSQVNSAFKYTWGTATDGTTGQIATDNTNNYFDYLGTLFIRNATSNGNRLILSSTGDLTIGSTAGTGAGTLYAGATTLTGALNGTSGTFSGNLSGASIFLANSVNGLVTITGNSGGNQFNQSQGLAIGWNYSAGGGEVAFSSNKGAGTVGGYKFYDWNGTTATQLLSISPSGSAIFASSVTAGGNLQVAGANTATPLGVKTNTNQNWRILDNSGAQFDCVNDALDTRVDFRVGAQLYIAASGNVGIGTTSPAAKLDIKASGDGDLIVGRFSAGAAKLIYGYQAGSDGYLELRTGDNAIVTKLSGYTGTPSYFLSNVGIGTTTPYQKLEVNGVIESPYLEFKPVVFYDFNSNTTSDWSAYNATLSVPSKSVVRYTSTGTDSSISRGFNFSGGQNQIIRIRYKVISGTPGSGEIFYTNSVHSYDGSYFKGFTLVNDGNWHTLVLDMSSLSAGGTDWIDYNVTAIRFDLTNNNSVVIDIDWISIGGNGYGTQYFENDVAFMNGNVGIGTTSPGAKLDINGDINIGALNIVGAVGGGPSLAVTFKPVNASSVNTGYEFQLNPAGGAYGNFTVKNVDSGLNQDLLRLSAQNLAGDSYINVPDTSQNISLRVNNSVKFYLQGSSGNVGIGTTLPSQLLTVYQDTNGDARLSLNNPNTGASARTFLYAITTGNRYVGMLAYGANATGTTLGLSNASLGTLEAGGDISNLLISSPSTIVFGANSSERMRITIGGTLKMASATISNNNAVFAAEELGGYKYFQGTLANGEKFGSQGGTYVLGFYFITWFDGSSSRGYAMYATTNPTANAGTVLISSGGTYTASATYNASSAVSLAFDGSSRGAVLSNNTGVSLTFYAYVFGGV
jgi:hypothetical protein